ncbi:hypothetical protein GL325_14430 [Aeromicrobium sp. 636]|uniref:DUF5709 domain-containing protein n=1 Tax=Aeromicrobium senzhongii TaxID=2663859 RepID=A0A8I0EXI0_9ACTN|nr:MULTISPECIES: DUF5709 domain-containing protein [Aeromicrobium]MBC9227523.1 hypothetical protein [Aeromicrobium senzhongii]MCQ3999620.1 hypothetical protein [Aeromicrobium sp. 636]MTB88061.1 hypothetical protein [Aeromicrobium senzhongii]QNL94939.1 hypothetical protein H9L21_02995 [Aeromicrobium senzhongii]
MSDPRNPAPAPAQYPTQQQNDDTLMNREPFDPLDEGISPPERWSPGEGFGTTVEEQLEGESFDLRLSQEVPDVDPDAEWSEENLDDGEVGGARSGRLVDPDGGIGEDRVAELVGEDVGIDGAAASAEEAAVHVVEDE